MSDSPYRESSALSIEMAWTTEDGARRGYAELVAMLEREGADLEAAAQVALLPATLALCDAEGETRIYVSWEIARVVNRVLDVSPSTRRLFRAGAESTRWLLLTPEEADARRARGQTVLSSPPPVFSPRERRSALVVLAGALVAVGALVATMWMAGEYVALAATAVAVAVGSLIGRRLAPEGAPRARRALVTALVDGPLLIPIARLAWLGEHQLLVALIAALAFAAGAKQLSTRMARAPS